MWQAGEAGQASKPGVWHVASVWATVCAVCQLPRQCMEICVHTWSLSSYIRNNNNNNDNYSNPPRCKLTRSQALGACPPGRLLIELLQQHRGDQLRFIGTTWPAPCRALCVVCLDSAAQIARLRIADCGLRSAETRRLCGSRCVAVTT